MLAHEGLFFMTESEEQKRIAKRLLEIEEEQEVQKAQQALTEQGFPPGTSGAREVGLVKVKYALKKEAIDEGIKLPASEVNYKATQDRDLENKRLPFLPNSGKKNIRLRKLQNLFIKRNEAAFDVIAKEIGLNKNIRSYSPSQRKIIINLQKNFNKYSKKAWDMTLSSTYGVDGITFDGLRIISTSIPLN